MEAAEIVDVFNACFDRKVEQRCDRARMLAGDEEPIYLPPDASHDYGRIYFAHGFAASVLHEAAHWLRAGCERRMRSDYGYWYLPDGRDAVAQARFEEQEWAVQAIECTLSAACGVSFHFSADNLSNPEPSALFKHRVAGAVQRYCENPPVRVRCLQEALCEASESQCSELLDRCRSLLSDEAASLRHMRGADYTGFLK